MNTRKPQSVINILALTVTLVVNGLATSLPLGGRTTGEISDSFDILFVPAGYVFSIWGLIYLALIGFAVFQALPRQQSNPLVRATGWWFALSCLANSVWIFLWHYGYYVWTLVTMVTLLLSLIVIYRRLAVQRQQTEVDSWTTWLVQLPFSVYLGWISVATVANASSVLDYLGWDGSPLSPVTWAVVMIGVAAALALTMLYLHRDLAYGAVVIWALVGILVKQMSVMPVVVAAAAAVGVIVLAAAVFQLRGPTARLQLAK